MRQRVHFLTYCLLFVVWIVVQLVLGSKGEASTSKIALPSGVIIIQNGRLLNGTGAEPIPDGLIAIKDGKIIAVGTKAQFQLPEGAQVLDAQGGTIMPGVIDAHTHILEASSRNLKVNLGNWLQAGVTTARDLGSSYKRAEIISFLKEKLVTYGNSVPTIVIAGPIITAPEGYPIPVWGRGIAWEVADVEEAQQAATRLIDSGVDQLKLAVERRQGWPTLSLEQVKAITAVAHQVGTRVSAHISYPDDAQTSVDGGVDELAHIPVLGDIILSETLVQQMVTQDMFLVPTLAVRNIRISRLPDAELRTRTLELVQASLQRFVNAGGKVALGSDFGVPGISQGMPLPDMEALLDAGMAPMQVLVAATKHAAEACGLGDRVGTLEVGKQADVIVVNGNPLEDIQVMRQVMIVMKNGEVIVQR